MVDIIIGLEYIQRKGRSTVNANSNYRLGYMDADAFIKVSNKTPGRVNLEKLFKVKGADYRKGFEQRLQTLAKEAQA
jgi:hypothetical protein